MNKQELIDKAVEKYQGKIPENGEVIITHHEDLFFVPERYAVSDPIHVHVCTAEQFNQRARELGWCNGYKYGVEYETNGKKPDLHPSVIVQVRIKGAKHFGEPLTIFEIIHWDKPNGSFHPFSFRIVDPRYKPVEAEQVQSDWYDYGKQQAVALPPVGVECGYISQFFGTKKHYSGNCKVIAYYQNKVWIDVVGYNEFVISLDVIKFRPLDWNRKAEEERDGAVCAAFKSLTISNGDLAYKICQDLYDNGYLKNKAAS